MSDDFHAYDELDAWGPWIVPEPKPPSTTEALQLKGTLVDSIDILCYIEAVP